MHKSHLVGHKKSELKKIQSHKKILPLLTMSLSLGFVYDRVFPDTRTENMALLICGAKGRM